MDVIALYWVRFVPVVAGDFDGPVKACKVTDGEESAVEVLAEPSLGDEGTDGLVKLSRQHLEMVWRGSRE